jgi:hypothetical protein
MVTIGSNSKFPKKREISPEIRALTNDKSGKKIRLKTSSGVH